jgi:hypothetical protein
MKEARKRKEVLSRKEGKLKRNCDVTSGHFFGASTIQLLEFRQPIHSTKKYSQAFMSRNCLL